MKKNINTRPIQYGSRSWKQRILGDWKEEELLSSEKTYTDEFQKNLSKRKFQDGGGTRDPSPYSPVIPPGEYDCHPECSYYDPAGDFHYGCYYDCLDPASCGNSEGYANCWLQWPCCIHHYSYCSYDFGWGCGGHGE